MLSERRWHSSGQRLPAARHHSRSCRRQIGQVAEQDQDQPRGVALILAAQRLQGPLARHQRPQARRLLPVQGVPRVASAVGHLRASRRRGCRQERRALDSQGLCVQWSGQGHWQCQGVDWWRRHLGMCRAQKGWPTLQQVFQVFTSIAELDFYVNLIFERWISMVKWFCQKLACNFGVYHKIFFLYINIFNYIKLLLIT